MVKAEMHFAFISHSAPVNSEMCILGTYSGNTISERENSPKLCIFQLSLIRRYEHKPQSFLLANYYRVSAEILLALFFIFFVKESKPARGIKKKPPKNFYIFLSLVCCICLCYTHLLFLNTAEPHWIQEWMLPAIASPQETVTSEHQGLGGHRAHNLVSAHLGL